jgi:hypothetical protein
MLPARRVARAIAATRGDAPGTRPPISALARGFASSDASGPEVVDVCVVGGGVVGTAMACLLRASPRTKHLSVTLVDRAAPPPSLVAGRPPRRGGRARQRAHAGVGGAAAKRRRLGSRRRRARSPVHRDAGLGRARARARAVRRERARRRRPGVRRREPNRARRARRGGEQAGRRRGGAERRGGRSLRSDPPRPLLGRDAQTRGRRERHDVRHDDDRHPRARGGGRGRREFARARFGGLTRAGVVVRAESRRGHGYSVSRERRGVAAFPARRPHRGAPRDGRPVRGERRVDQRAGGGGPARVSVRRGLRERSRRCGAGRREVRLFASIEGWRRGDLSVSSFRERRSR